MTSRDHGNDPEEERRKYLAMSLNRQLNERRKTHHKRGISCRATYAFRIKTGIITLECDYNPEKYATIIEQFIAENPETFCDRKNIGAIGGFITPIDNGSRKPTPIKSILDTLRRIKTPGHPNLN